jgi:hypothetical protein
VSPMFCSPSPAHSANSVAPRPSQRAVFVPFWCVGRGAFQMMTKDKTSAVRAAAAQQLAHTLVAEHGDLRVRIESEKRNPIPKLAISGWVKEKIIDL